MEKETITMMRRFTCGKRYGKLCVAMLMAMSLCYNSCTSETDKTGPDTSDAVSQFVQHVADDRKYEKTDPPSDPPVFRWDFSKADTAHTYS